MPVNVDRTAALGLLPNFIREDPILAALVGGAGDRAAAFGVSAQAVLDAFDVTTAVGEQLDRLGEIVGYPRQGEDDDRYRRLVQMQIQIVLTSAGTTDALLNIVRVWTGTDAPYYGEPLLGRAEAEIEASLDDLSDDSPLLAWLRKAKAGGVRLSVIESLAEDPMIIDYEGGDEVEGAGILDYEEGDEVEGAGLLAYGAVI